MGVGDCAGLRLIPGMTDSGKQKMPAWLAEKLGVKDSDYYGGEVDVESLKASLNQGGKK
jgi:hypothetical protein